MIENVFNHTWKKIFLNPKKKVYLIYQNIKKIQMTLERKIILISEKRTTLANIISAFIMLETQFNIQGERIYKE